jgi:hypothetical protein
MHNPLFHQLSRQSLFAFCPFSYVIARSAKRNLKRRSLGWGKLQGLLQGQSLHPVQVRALGNTRSPLADPSSAINSPEFQLNTNIKPLYIARSRCGRT